MKLYYTEISPPCRAVNMVIVSLNLSVEFEQVNLAERDHLKPEFLKVNPAHSIPTFVDDDGFVLFDSHAICSYLVSKYGKDDSLYPKDLQKRAKVDEQLHFANEIFIVYKNMTKPILYFKILNVNDADKAKIDDFLNSCEKILEKQDYFAGNQLTIADFSHISLLPSCTAYTDMSKEKYPHLNEWISRCSKNIKNYDEVNARGADMLVDNITNRLKGA